MKKTLIALAAAAMLFAPVAASTDAEARHRSWHTGATIAGAIIGGALIAGALAPHYRPYAEVEGFEPLDEYEAAAPVDCEGGYWGHSVVGHTRRGRPIYSEPRFFCPVN